MFLPDLLILGLKRNGDRPAIYIDGEMRTAAEMRDEISRYVQAFRAQGVELGSGVATLSKNRVEVLYSMGAVMVAGCRNTPLHPLGSLDDHAYVLEDAQIEHVGLRSAVRRPGSRAAASASPGCGACCRSARPTSATT